MAGYNHVNLKRDVEDSAPKFNMAPDIEARFASGSLELEKSAMSYQRIAPGKRQPFGHSHKEQEEVYIVVSGSGRAKLDEEIIELEALDAVRVAPETMRGFEAGAEGLAYVVIGAPKKGSLAEDVDGQEMGWWSD